jgi:hypothetical protein
MSNHRPDEKPLKVAVYSADADGCAKILLFVIAPGLLLMGVIGGLGGIGDYNPNTNPNRPSPAVQKKHTSPVHHR